MVWSVKSSSLTIMSLLFGLSLETLSPMTNNRSDHSETPSPDKNEGPRKARRKPKQSRSQQTFESILKAAGEIFSEQGYEQTTTHQVARRASISVGGLYRYFSDKEAILKEVYRREMSSLRNRVLESFVEVDLFSEDLASLVRRVMTMAFEVYSEKPDLLRVLDEQARRIPELAELRRSEDQEVQQAVRRILEGVPSVQVPDVEVGSYLIVLFLGSLIEDCVLYQVGSGELSKERIIDGAVDFLLRYVQGTR